MTKELLESKLRERIDATRERPNDPEAWSNLGASYLALGALDSALSGFGRAIDLQPNHPELHYNLGLALQKKGALEHALESYRRALEFDRRHAKAWNNIGVVLGELGQVEAALQAQRQAVALEPQRAEFHWTLSLTELLLGLYREGFSRYEWRRRMPGYKSIGGTEWHGEPAPEAKLVIYCEQGLGDALNFLRFVDEARSRVGKTVLQCREPLVPLVRRYFQDAVEITPKQPVSKDVLTVSLMSLPHVLQMTDRLGMDRPYLHADPALRTKWRRRLGSDKINIGLCWQGNPKHPQDWKRSIPLAELEPLLDRPDCAFFSLQKEDGLSQLQARSGLPVVDFGEDLDRDAPFLDSAALLMELDLFITVDTSLAHLAGALGATAWMLLHFPPDYRWGLEKQPWYPTITTFRKRPFEDWRQVIARTKKDLDAFVAAKKERS